jgi:type IV secretory pathway TraG/TraD family ATPase VirD4
VSTPSAPGSSGVGVHLAGAVAGTVVVGTASAWVCAGVLNVVVGDGWQTPKLSLDLLPQMAGHGTSSHDGWPTLPMTAWWSATTVVTVVLVTALILGYRLAYGGADQSDSIRALARPHDVAPLTPRVLKPKAQRDRPSLAAKKAKEITGRDTGLILGAIQLTRTKLGCQLRSSWEDVVLAIMAPRSGKTTCLSVPYVLEAPGAVVATSNKSDVWAATAQLRRERTGEAVWTFDPQHIAHLPQTWFWNPLRGLDSVEEAERLASHFVGTVDDEQSRDIWGPAAKTLLSGLFLAAAVTHRTILDVYAWVQDEGALKPINLLNDNGFPAMAKALEGLRNRPAETRGGVYFTAQEATACLRNPDITRWVMPPEDSTGTRYQDRGPVPDAEPGPGPGPEAEAEAAVDLAPALLEFVPRDFALTHQTMYLLSKDGGGSASPLVAALADRIMRNATQAAEALGGRLDPPMVVVLDEAANVCRIADLPDLYSHLGSRGVIPVTILQSFPQGVRVWGQTGMDTLYGAATVKVIGPGIEDDRFAETISSFVGDREVWRRSFSHGDGRTTRSDSLQRERSLDKAGVRALPRGKALIFATGCKPAMVRLIPWYETTDKGAIEASRKVAEAQITAAASQRRQTVG